MARPAVPNTLANENDLLQTDICETIPLSGFGLEQTV